MKTWLLVRLDDAILVYWPPPSSALKLGISWAVSWVLAHAHTMGCCMWYKISWDSTSSQVLTLQGTSYTNHGHRYAGWYTCGTCYWNLEGTSQMFALLDRYLCLSSNINQVILGKDFRPRVVLNFFLYDMCVKCQKYIFTSCVFFKFLVLNNVVLFTVYWMNRRVGYISFFGRIIKIQEACKYSQLVLKIYSWPLVISASLFARFSSSATSLRERGASLIWLSQR